MPVATESMSPTTIVISVNKPHLIKSAMATAATPKATVDGSITAATSGITSVAASGGTVTDTAAVTTTSQRKTLC